ncbi:MAG: IPTL-CTERM sorting domain-containing protein [Planctomycetota bacterium]|nr:IPTL-CTERM sorting domain-containing protein [Planctomycetota bacterium]
MNSRHCALIVLVFAFGMTPEIVFAQFETLWELGAPGRGWPQDQGGVLFIQETGTNDPPGNPMSPAVAQQADDDYYVGGEYPAPIGVVPDENVMERAFAGTDNDLRIHFNIPADVSPEAFFRFSFEANNLDDRGKNADPRYGVEVSFNGNVILSGLTIRADGLNNVNTTFPRRLEDVGALFGPGGDNVLALRGVNMNNDGGGAWMGMDYHHLEINRDAAFVVPTLSEWGMIFLSLVVVALGGLFVRRRRLSLGQATK